MFIHVTQDNKDARHVKTYEVQLKEKDFGEGPWLQNNLDNGAGLLIPVPLPLGGAIIIGEQTIVYYNGSVFKAIPIRPVCVIKPCSVTDLERILLQRTNI